MRWIEVQDSFREQSKCQYNNSSLQRSRLYLVTYLEASYEIQSWRKDRLRRVDWFSRTAFSRIKNDAKERWYEASLDEPNFSVKKEMYMR